MPHLCDPSEKPDPINLKLLACFSFVVLTPEIVELFGSNKTKSEATARLGKAKIRFQNVAVSSEQIIISRYVTTLSHTTELVVTVWREDTKLLHVWLGWTAEGGKASE